MADYVTLKREKHKLLHFSTYATAESPRPKKKGIWYLRTGYGKKVQRGEFKQLGDRSKRRFYACVKCACWPLPNERP